MKPQGQVLLQDGRYVLDAAPHIMSRVRALFDNGMTSGEPGFYTHKPVLLPVTRAAARDIIMLCTRYPLDIDPLLQGQIDTAAAEYDRIREATAKADSDPVLAVGAGALDLAVPLREHQVVFRNMWGKVRRILNADRMGLGKTFSGLSGLLEPERRPALIVCPTTLCKQWERETARLLPGAKTHIIKGHKNYELPPADVYITAYTRLDPWQDVLVPARFKTLILDEVQEVRRHDARKSQAARAISATVEYCAGLSGTPIINYGSEIWSVMETIAPGALGDEVSFNYEWCTQGIVREPIELHSYLKDQGLFLRRTPEDVGLTFGQASKHVYTLDADLDQLKNMQDVMKTLAITMLSGVVGESDAAGRDFDHKLRHATGVAKARPVAEFVRLLLDEERKVLLVGYHHDVYDIWAEELKHFNPVRVTGHETANEKDAHLQRFIKDDDCRVLMLSLRCAAGLDGLQHVCKTAVVGELDWSPHLMDQNITRLAREGQKHHVQAFFMTVNDGADPFMTTVLNLKRSQHDGLIEGLEGEATVLDSTYDPARVREMAIGYLKSIGEEIPVPVAETGLLGEVAAALRRVRVPTNSEAEMQAALWSVLPGLLETAKVEREVKVGQRSRLDFLATRGDERVAIECKIKSTERPEVYRQVRRYAEEANITALVLHAPWAVPNFIVDQVPVIVVNSAAAGF